MITTINEYKKVNESGEDWIMYEFDQAYHGMIGALKAAGTPVEIIIELQQAYNNFGNKVKSILAD